MIDDGREGYRATSMFCYGCECGVKLKSPDRETECPACHRIISVAWPPWPPVKDL